MTDATGLCSVSVSSDIPGTVSVRVAVGGKDVTGTGGLGASPVEVTFVAAPQPTFAVPVNGETYELSELTTLSGTAQAGSTVRVSQADAILCTATVDETGHWSCTHAFVSSGIYQVGVTATVSDRVYGPVTVSFTVRDLLAPVVLTANASTISGTATAGLNVRVVDLATDSLVGTALIDSDGTWRMSTPEGISSGDIAVQAVNQFGGLSAQTTVALDADVPQTPLIAHVTALQLGGTLPGVVDPGTVVTVTYPRAGGVGTMRAVVGADGSWSATLPSSAVPGAVSVVAEDPAGNVSPAATVTINRPTVVLDESSVMAGGTLVVSGSGWVSGESVAVTVRSVPLDLGTVTARDDGRIPDVAFTVPEDFEPGAHSVTLVGSLSGSVEATFTVEAAPEPQAPQGGVSAPTGGAAVPGPGASWLLIILASFAAGSLLAWGCRRKA